MIWYMYITIIDNKQHTYTHCHEKENRNKTAILFQQVQAAKQSARNLTVAGSLGNAGPALLQMEVWSRRMCCVTDSSLLLVRSYWIVALDGNLDSKILKWRMDFRPPSSLYPLPLGPGIPDAKILVHTASALMGSMGSLGLDRPRPLPPRVVLVTFWGTWVTFQLRF